MAALMQHHRITDRARPPSVAVAYLGPMSV
jgi:hypothetical protein